MSKFNALVGVSLVVGLLILGAAVAQEGGGSAPAGGPGSYGPGGGVPTVPGTDVPAPAGPAPAGPGPGNEAPGAAPGAETGGGGDAGIYVEVRQGKAVFESTCLKCHPREKILKRRTEARWKQIVLGKHLMQGRINMSDAAPVLSYLNANYSVPTAPSGPTPAPTPTKPPTAPAPPPAPAPAPAAGTTAPAPAPPPAPPPETPPAPEQK